MCISINLEGVFIVTCRLYYPTKDFICFSIKPNTIILLCLYRSVAWNANPANKFSLSISTAHICKEVQSRHIGGTCLRAFATINSSDWLTILLKRNVSTPIATRIKEATCSYIVEEELLPQRSWKSRRWSNETISNLFFCQALEPINTRDNALSVNRLGIRIDCDGSHGKDSECLCYASALDASHHRIQKFGNLFHFGKI